MTTIAILLSMALLWNCEKAAEDQTRQILRHVVIQYNRILSECYSNLNMTDLLEIATEDRVRKAYYHMSALGEAGIRMKPNMINIRFTGIRPGGDEKAEVTTHETWEYIHVKIDDGTIKSRKRASYDMQYFLTKQEGRWLVADVKIMKADEKEY